MVTRAPLRVSFGGGGTDLPAYYRRHGGFVLSAAIDRYCHVLTEASTDGRTTLSSADCGSWLSFERGESPTVGRPLPLHRAALDLFARHGRRVEGLRIFTASEVPPGTGLGSSSAMVVALARAFAEHVGEPMTPDRLAELACEVEIDRLEMPIGKQDQYAAAFGGINAITFEPDGVSVRPLALPGDVISALESRLLLFSTGHSRNSADILSAQQRGSTEPGGVVESLHALKALGMEMLDALLAQDLDGFGRLLHSAWERKKRLSDRVSSAAIDRSYQLARHAGALGGKITGAGGGGFLLLYCPEGAQGSVREAMNSSGLPEMTFGFDFRGAHTMASGTVLAYGAG